MSSLQLRYRPHVKPALRVPFFCLVSKYVFHCLLWLKEVASGHCYTPDLQNQIQTATSICSDQSPKHAQVFWYLHVSWATCSTKLLGSNWYEDSNLHDIRIPKITTNILRTHIPWRFWLYTRQNSCSAKRTRPTLAIETTQVDDLQGTEWWEEDQWEPSALAPNY